MKKLYYLPSSGQVIGALFEVLRVPRPSHIAKEMQRYFRGEKIEEPTRKEILYLFVDALLEKGILPPQPLDPVFECRWGLKKALVRAIDDSTQRWESVCAKLRYWPIPVSRRQGLLFSIFRLAVIDLAFRVACYRYIAGLPKLERPIPLWAKRGGNASFLKLLKARCDEKPTNSELAGEAGVVNEKSIAAWFSKGERPSPKHLKTLAAAFTRRMTGIEYDTVLAEMTRHYTFATLCDSLTGTVRRDRVLELVVALYDQTNRIMDFLEHDDLPAEQRTLHWFLQLVGGTSRSYQAPWLRYLWDTEKDLEWKQDMVCVESDWESRLFQVNLRFIDEGVLERRSGTNYLYINPYDVPPSGGGYYGALLHRDDPDGVSASFDYVSASYIDNKIDGEMALWGGAGQEAYEWDKKTENQFRLAIESNPDSARAHLDLGVFLGLHGYLPTHLEEGYKECIKAIELQPEWELPWIETANILLHAGDSGRALELLHNSTSSISCPSYRMVYTVAFAKMINQDFGGALEMFEKATQMKRDFAPALENAAFCAFRLGNRLKGRRYAKIARRLGISTTYDLYDVGKTKQKPNSLPFEILCETVLCPQKNCRGRAESEKFRQELLQKYLKGTKPTSRPYV